MGYRPLPADRFVQMRTIEDLPANIMSPLREMLWAAWSCELRRDGRGM